MLNMTEYKLYKSRSKAVKLLLLSTLFVAGGIFMLQQADAPRWAAWLCIVFFGMGIPLGFFQLLDRRPQILINEWGIFDRTLHRDFINWEIIRDAYLASVNGQQFICLVVDKEFEPSKKKGGIQRQLASLNKELGFQELNLNVGSVQVDAARLTAFILAMKSAEKPGRAALMARSLADLV